MITLKIILVTLTILCILIILLRLQKYVFKKLSGKQANYFRIFIGFLELVIAILAFIATKQYASFILNIGLVVLGSAGLGEIGIGLLNLLADRQKPTVSQQPSVTAREIPSMSSKEKLLKTILPASLIILNFFLFTPFIIYQANISEFSVSLASILSYLLLPALVILAVLLIIAIFLPPKGYKYYVSLLFVLGVLIWLQGNILVWKYGLFDGQGINWSKGSWRGLLDGIIWLSLLASAFLFYKFFHKIMSFACIALIVLQLSYLGIVSFQKNEIWQSKAPEKMYFQEWISDFSKKQNIIHIILDAFQSDIFEDIINKDRSYYDKALDGFIFFKETSGSFPTTYMSIPAILSGKNYQNDVPMPEFVRTTLKGKTIPNIVLKNGFEVDFIPFGSRYHHGLFTNVYEIPIPYVMDNKEYTRAQSLLMIDLVLFRTAPHFLKKFVYRNELWLIQSLSNQGENKFVQISHRKFFDDLMSQISIKRERPVYKFIHLAPTHIPIVLNDACKYEGKVFENNRDNFKRQAKCGLDQFILFLEKLKSMGLYESSLIMLHSDHGAHYPINFSQAANKNVSHYIEPNIAGAAAALLLIKTPNSNGPLKTLSSQTMLSDIPDTVSSLLNIPESFGGKSVFLVNPHEARRRVFYNYEWSQKNWYSDYLERIDEYIITGSLFDKSSWQRGRSFYSPHASFDQKEKIVFGTKEISTLLLNGWGGNDKLPEEGFTVNWALGNSASMRIALPQTQVQMRGHVKSFPFDKPEIVIIKVDGKKIGQWELSNRWEWEYPSILIPADSKRPSVSIIEFNFSAYHEPQPADKDQRPLAVMFESITFSEK